VGSPVLGYSTNCYPGESCDELVTALRGEVAEVRRALGGAEPLNLALRIGRQQAAEIAARPELVEDLRAALDSAGARAVGANAFPISAPSDGVYKDGIYRPDWRSPERLQATLQIARALAALLDEGERGVLSTLTGTCRLWPGAEEPEAEEACAANLQACARGLEKLSAETGRELVLALEPEPFTTADTLPGTLGYFRERLFAGEDEPIARRRLGVNLDLCHAAVTFEPAAENMRAYAREGIGLFGLHVSAALRVENPADHLEELRAFDEPVYLHQVSAADRAGEVALCLPDLGDFLALPQKTLKSFKQARVHFHVPVFAEAVRGLPTSAHLTWQPVRAARDEGLTDLFIVETYTWKQIGDMDRRGQDAGAHPVPGIPEGIAHELARARDVLAGG